MKRHRSLDDKTQFHFAMSASGEGVTAPDAHNETIQQKFKTTQKRKKKKDADREFPSHLLPV